MELLSENSREEFEPQNPSVQQCDILAAHYVGDASSYNVRDHSHYYGKALFFICLNIKIKTNIYKVENIFFTQYPESQGMIDG